MGGYEFHREMEQAGLEGGSGGEDENEKCSKVLRGYTPSDELQLKREASCWSLPKNGRASFWLDACL